MLLNKTLRLFLDSIGRRDEYEFYLNKFQSVDSPCFALVCPDHECMQQAADVLLFDLEFLLKLELRPVVLLAGPWARSVRDALSVERDLCRFLDLDAASPGSCFAWLEDAFAQQAVPVLCSNRELLALASDLLPSLTPRVHLVRMRGALHQEGHGVLPFFNTASSGSCRVESEDEAALDLGRRLLDQVSGLHVSVTSPIELLPEIFTVKGAGTVLRRGRTIRHVQSLADVDEARLIELLGSSFGKPLVDASFLERVDHFYLEEDYRGAAMVENQVEGAYLTKFAVGHEARGEGLAQQLWRALEENHPALYWRARDANPINQWYERKAEGRCRLKGWTVFWRGLDVDDVPRVLHACVARPTDFEEQGAEACRDDES